MAKKAEFRVGQVVHTIDGSYGKLVSPHQAMPLQCASGQPLFNADGHAFLTGAKERWYHISELRSLTAGEIGPRHRRGKR